MTALLKEKLSIKASLARIHSKIEAKRQAEQDRWNALTPEQQAEETKQKAIQAESYRLLDLQEKAARKDREIRQVADRLMGGSSIYQGIRLQDDTNKPTQVIQALLMEHPKRLKAGYLIIGGTGSGKTYGAIAFIAEMAGTINARAEMVHAYNMARRINARDWDELQVFERVKFLLIDDLGAEPEGFRGADFHAHFDYLMNERHSHRLTTVITSNMTRKVIIERYGERFISRFRENGQVIETTDPDFRQSETIHD